MYLSLGSHFPPDCQEGVQRGGCSSSGKVSAPHSQVLCLGVYSDAPVQEPNVACARAFQELVFDSTVPLLYA